MGTFPKRMVNVLGASSAQKDQRDFWQRFRANHRYGWALRAARQSPRISRQAKSGKGAFGLPAPRNGIEKRSVDTCSVGAGEMLRATLVIPNTEDGPWPCILMRTPYGRSQ